MAWTWPCQSYEPLPRFAMTSVGWTLATARAVHLMFPGGLPRYRRVPADLVCTYTYSLVVAHDGSPNSPHGEPASGSMTNSPDPPLSD